MSRMKWVYWWVLKYLEWSEIYLKGTNMYNREDRKWRRSDHFSLVTKRVQCILHALLFHFISSSTQFKSILPSSTTRSLFLIVSTIGHFLSRNGDDRLISGPREYITLSKHRFHVQSYWIEWIYHSCTMEWWNDESMSIDLSLPSSFFPSSFYSSTDIYDCVRVISVEQEYSCEWEGKQFFDYCHSSRLEYGCETF